MTLFNRLTEDQGKFYEDLLNEQQDLNNHIPLHIARLQQMENQYKQHQSQWNQEKKDEKLTEIIQFIQEKILPLLDEDSILKFFGQKNSSSNDKDIQSIKRSISFTRILRKKFLF